MPDNFEKALSISSNRFNKVIMPILEKEKGYKSMTVEGNAHDEMRKLLDIQAGIDVWIYDDIGIKGLSSRIQTTYKSWDTFTVRKERSSGAKTEYYKRTQAIKKNYLYPHLTLQAYFDDDKLLAFAIARTKDILKLIDSDKCYVSKTNSDQIGQASFYVIEWSDVKTIYIKRLII